MFRSLLGGGDASNEKKSAGAQDSKDGEKNSGGPDVSSVTSFMGSMFKTIGESVKSGVEAVADKALSDFNSEQEKFLRQKHKKSQESALPPWTGAADEDKLKAQIIALSLDKRNFLRDPPPGSGKFVFDYDEYSPIALTMLEEDPRLQEMRFELVPKQTSEEHFWRNYFYRVSLIKQSSELTALAASDAEKTDSSLKTDDSLVVVPSFEDQGDEDNGEDDLGDAGNESDASLHEEQPEVDIHADLNELDSTTAEIKTAEVLETKEESDHGGSTEEWEQELANELQGFELVDEDLGDLDLGEGVDEDWEAEIDEMLEAEN